MNGARAYLARLGITDRIAPVIVPAFVMACVAFGGASQENLLQSAALPLAAIVCLMWILFDRSLEDMPRTATAVLWFTAGYVLIAALQLVPLPPDVWTRLPGRGAVQAGFAVFGGPLPWLPLSQAPEKTLSSLLQILPPLAVFMMAVKLRWRHAIAPMLWTLPLLGAASLALGAVQAMGGEASDLYIYPTTNRGQPVGFFANVNHQASFLVMCLPFVGALVASLRHRSQTGEGVVEKVVLAIALGGACVTGVIVAGSIAGYILLGPALICAIIIASARGGDGAGRSIAALLVGIIALAAALASSPFVEKAGTSLDNGRLSRGEIYANTIEGIREQGIVGAGLGAFQQVYPRFENPDVVYPTYANHAHNDYLEMAFEAGLAGVALLAGLIVWWLTQAMAIWRGPLNEEGRVRCAAAIATAVVLLHSLVDYPLRTTAIASVAAFCLAAMIAVRRRPVRPSPSVADNDATDARNIVL